MKHHTTRFFKPTLEHLEERAQPSVLFPNNIAPQLAAPLNALIADMNAAQKDLATQIGKIPSGVPVNSGPALPAFGQASADYQRLLTDQQAISAASKADVAFLTAVAGAEFAAGDPTDLLVLNFGAMLGINATASLTTPVNQAAQVVNDPTVQKEIATGLLGIAIPIPAPAVGAVIPVPVPFGTLKADVML
jgi:hypothetical protein